MTIDPLPAFLQELEQHGVRLEAENGQLRYWAKPGALTPELRAGIAARKAELLQHLREQERTQSTNAAAHLLYQAALGKARRDRPLPLSFQQEPLWFLDQLEGPSPTYTTCQTWHLHGRLYRPVFERAFAEVVRRHDSLRTTIAPAGPDRVPAQVVHESSGCTPIWIDLADLPGSGRLAEAVRRAEVFLRQPFDLIAGPLIRFHGFILGPEEHLLVLAAHHIIFDAWSADVFHRELAALYGDYLAERSPSLPPLTYQYGDFAAWQREHADAGGFAEGLAFWRRQLDGAPLLLEFAPDFRRPESLSNRGARVRMAVPTAQLTRLHELGRRDNATLFHVLAAAWSIVLSRHSGSRDIVVGTPVSSRDQIELESMIGLLINTIVLRARFQETTTTREAIQHMRDAALAALAYRDVPFERVVQELNPPRSLSHTPIFQACIAFQQENKETLQFHDLACSPVPLQLGVSKFDLTLWLAQNPAGLEADLEFSTDLFSYVRAKKILAHFCRILEVMPSHPDAPIDRLEMLPDEERKQILVGWNDTERGGMPDACVHELFEEQTRSHPDAIALVFGNETLTYADLNKRADCLAAHLRSQGVGPDALVALCVERSPAMVIGMLGILKAGGAYVPVDPAYPPDRIAFVVADAKARVFVTERRLLNALPAMAGCRVLIDEPLPEPTSPAANPLGSPRASNLAYVLYTSGSTGKPKGVQIEHGALVNFLRSMRRMPGLTTEDVLLAVTTLSFDIAGLELFLPLTTGAKIILASREVAADGEALLRAIDRQRVTVLQATPATWRLILAAGWKRSPRLKALCGGEALPPDLATELLPRCAELWNMYGPTETTIWSTCSRVTNAQDINIGRPIDNTEIHILDAHREPLPVGVAGELFIGGAGLARGYLNRPDLTAEKFVPHPFKANQRLYRTGDLARHRNDGTIDCLGRLDFQVKIRGFRIELGEIEVALNAHAGVKESVVVAREDSPGDKRLIAYLVSRSPTQLPQASELREHLRATLPEYMIPAAFVLLDSLPLTPNGKINRQVLPAPDGVAVLASKTNVPPRNPTEKELMAIFEKVLNTPVGSVEDNFFELGGHSILAVRLMASIERDLGVRLPLATLLKDPTVEGIAMVLRDTSKISVQPGWSPLVSIQPHGTRPPLFLVHGAGGNVLLYRDLARRLDVEQPLFGFQSIGLDGQTPPLATVEEMAQAYLPFLRRIQPSGPYYLGGYCMGGMVAYEMARHLVEEGEPVALLALLDSYNLSTIQAAGGKHGVHMLERFRFHLGNLARLGPREMVGYLKEKTRIARDGELSKILMAVFGSGQKLETQSRSIPRGITVHAANDRAATFFQPRAFGGRLTLFRPTVNYDLLSDLEMGWRGLPSDGIDVVELAVNPHGMLMEPFVKQLAVELQRRLSGLTGEVTESKAKSMALHS